MIEGASDCPFIRVLYEYGLIGEVMSTTQCSSVQKPSSEAIADFQSAYEHFNRELFGNTLNPCLITFSRKRGAYGYFFARRWGNVETKDVVHEIGINQAHMERGDAEVLGTLVHEMVHLWQEQYGDPPKRVYHDSEWADKMEEVGLMPSTTGEPNGKRTGVKCSHYVVAGGGFELSYDKLRTMGFKIRWVGMSEEEREKQKRPKDKFKYQCGCEHKAWAKAGLRLRCDDCGELMVQEGAEKGGGGDED